MNMMRKDVRLIIDKLERFELTCNQIPESLFYNREIVSVGRRLGLRRSLKKGYDVINRQFFVLEGMYILNKTNELVLNGKRKVVFNNFSTYYSFLEGDVYENACYYQYIFTEEDQNLIDCNKIPKSVGFIDYTIDDFSFEKVKEDINLEYVSEIEEWKEGEQVKKLLIQYHNRLISSNTYDEFRSIIEKIKELDNRIRKNFGDENRTVKIMLCNFISESSLDDELKLCYALRYLICQTDDFQPIVRGLCAVFNPDEVLKAYSEAIKTLSAKEWEIHKSTLRKRKGYLLKFAGAAKSNCINKNIRCFLGNTQNKTSTFYDSKNHYYCDMSGVYACDDGSYAHSGMHCRGFTSFEEFIVYRNGDLRGCDLTYAHELVDVDFSCYQMDDLTKLPKRHVDYDVSSLNYIVKKFYGFIDHKTERDNKPRFIVIQEWRDKSGELVASREHGFEYFFDFVTFLRGDLSDGNYTLCSGLENLVDCQGLNISGIKARSIVYDKFGILYEKKDFPSKKDISFNITSNNEKETLPVFLQKREISQLISLEEYAKVNKVYYITDIHLMHRIKNAEGKTEEDILYIISKTVQSITDSIKEYRAILLIGGDTCCNFSLFGMFCKMLGKRIKEKGHTVIFILGNHEYWNNSNIETWRQNDIHSIVNRYRQVIEENGMYLLHNDIMYKDDVKGWTTITENEMLTLMDTANVHEVKSAINDALRGSRITILGGTGFSGNNLEFNADNGIYKKMINRETEIIESKVFESIYDVVSLSAADKNLIVFTHMPKNCWHSKTDMEKKIIYVSGHTHKNCFNDDGEYRNYADNQIGYHCESVFPKYFYMDNDYDWFADYADGIYEITNDQYADFYRGKNLQMTFNIEVEKLYMLKKDGFYCFICKNKGKQGNLSLLNGGLRNKIPARDIQYYYDNMDRVIAYLRRPLEVYTRLQKQVSNEIKKFGGSGKVHGCIVDIDFFNHVYVNPFDCTIRGYWALDMVEKIVYPEIAMLLEERLPDMYLNYNKLLENNEISALTIKNNILSDGLRKPTPYYDTDMYAASRQVRKLQRLQSDILSYWYEPSINTISDERNLLE